MADASQRRPLASVSSSHAARRPARSFLHRLLLLRGRSSSATAPAGVLAPIDRAPNKPSQIGPMIISNVDAAGFWGPLDPRTALC